MYRVYLSIIWDMGRQMVVKIDKYGWVVVRLVMGHMGVHHTPLSPSVYV